MTLVNIPVRWCTHPGMKIDQRDLKSAESICRQFGVKCNSAYRSPEHNALVGGAPNSDHLRGTAVDFVGTPGQINRLYKWAQGKFAYVEPLGQAGFSHVHISFQHGGSGGTTLPTIGAGSGVSPSPPVATAGSGCAGALALVALDLAAVLIGCLHFAGII